MGDSKENSLAILLIHYGHCIEYEDLLNKSSVYTLIEYVSYLNFGNLVASDNKKIFIDYMVNQDVDILNSVVQKMQISLDYFISESHLSTSVQEYKYLYKELTPIFQNAIQYKKLQETLNIGSTTSKSIKI